MVPYHTIKVMEIKPNKLLSDSEILYSQDQVDAAIDRLAQAITHEMSDASPLIYVT